MTLQRHNRVHALQCESATHATQEHFLHAQDSTASSTKRSGGKDTQLERGHASQAHTHLLRVGTGR
jgi:hypothetical protein